MMITPSGRFVPNKRLCFTMSDYHPELWNPMWSVSSILMGLLSFMLDHSTTTGSIETTDAEKRKYAQMSMHFNMQNNVFKKMFPQLVQEFNASTKRVNSQHASQNDTHATTSFVNFQKLNHDREVIEAMEEVFSNTEPKTHRIKKGDHTNRSNSFVILWLLFAFVAFVVLLVFMMYIM
jgi:Flp pilus assembly protein TadB